MFLCEFSGFVSILSFRTQVVADKQTDKQADKETENGNNESRSRRFRCKAENEVFRAALSGNPIYRWWRISGRKWIDAAGVVDESHWV